jgi:uncharacterized protein DUF3467
MEPNDVDRSKVGEGRYSNYAEIGHNASEFVFDFGQVWFDGTPAGVYLRVITNPDTAQRLYELLNDALSQYRSAFGEIRRGPAPPPDGDQP